MIVMAHGCMFCFFFGSGICEDRVVQHRDCCGFARQGQQDKIAVRQSRHDHEAEFVWQAGADGYDLEN